MVRIRTRKNISRFAILGGTLCSMTLMKNWSSGPSSSSFNSFSSERRELSGSGGTYDVEECFSLFPEFCDSNGTNICSIDEDYAYTCCNNNDECITETKVSCDKRWLCSAELVPGGNGAAKCLESWERNGGAWFYIALLLFLFLGLAIVCDDYFVTALEKISEGLGLSEDVAGATFMAAGSSAPELFVSLADNVISNPPKSVGIGTIVGSAIFNILVIIGLSALLAGQHLLLDWRPLARDVFFYLCSIAILTAVVFDGKVQWWEALCLLSLYVLYISFMVVNANFFAWLDKKLGIEREDDEKQSINNNNNDDDQKSYNKNVVVDIEKQENDKPGVSFSGLDDQVELSLADINREEEDDDNKADNTTTNIPHTVETSRPSEAIEAARQVMRLERHDSDPTNVSQRFNTTASGRNLGQNPLHQSKNRAGWTHMNKSGSLRFTKPQTSENPKMVNVAQTVIRAKRTVNKWQQATEAGKKRRMMEEGGLTTDDSITKVNSVSLNGQQEENIENSPTNEGEEEVEEEEGYWDCLLWPTDDGESVSDEDGGSEQKTHSCFQRYCCGWSRTWGNRLWYVLSFPHNLLYRITIPDCNYDVFNEDKEGKIENRKIGYWISFVMCIVWIAILSHFLVFAAGKFGCIVGISPPVMGLTLIAAGTSVPDAISSIIVAKQGQGDMAVANSIGSNVFDILIGLGLPWLIATGFVYKTPSIIHIDDLWVGLGFLFGVVVCLVGILIISGWILGRRVGATLILLYVLYIIFELFIH